MMKRIIALLLALILTVGLLPTVALAAGETENNDVVPGKYVNGVWTKGDLTQTLPAGVKSINKTATKTGDNTYDVTLEVVLKQTEENSGKAATVLVLDTSGSMAYCAECGTEGDCVHNYVKFNGTPNSKGQYYYKTTDKNGKEEFERAYYCDRKHTLPNKKHTAGWFTTSGDSIWHDPQTDSLAGQTIYVKSPTPRASRLDAAKVAAENFLKTYSGLTFKTDGTPADNQNNRNLGRYVSVVSFATKAESVQSWVDVSNSDVYKEVLKNIKRLNANGGTNLDAGLTYAEYLLKQTTVNDAVKNVIALTDGQPTFFIDTNERAYNDDGLTGLDREFLTIDNTTYRVHGTGDSCNAKTFTETVASADAVKNHAKLYTVCFDAEEKIDVPNNGGQISVSEYLSTKIATQPTKTGEQFAYDADNAEKLYAEFAKITQSIVSGLNNGTVRDTLPTGITSEAFGEDNVKEWKLNEKPFTKNETTNTVDGKQVTTYTYTYTYTVTINPLTVEKTKIDGTYYAPLNGETTLTVKNGDKNVTIHFPIPAGKVTMPSHTVTWMPQDGQGNAYETDTGVAYNARPSYDGTEPTKAADAEHTYTFVGWATTTNQTSGSTVDALPNVTADVTYYAAFSATKQTYTIRFETEAGGTLTGTTECTGLSYGADFPAAPTTTSNVGYYFAGWYDANDNKVTDWPNTVTENATYTAKWLSYNSINLDLTGKIQKTLNSDVALTNEIFTINLTLNGAEVPSATATATVSPALDNGSYTDTKPFVAASDNFKLAFTAPGIYNYSIVEEDGQLAGMTYDVNKPTDGHKLTVNVTADDTTHALSFESVTVDGTSIADVTVATTWLTITNTYTEPKEPRVVSKTVVTTDMVDTLPPSVSSDIEAFKNKVDILYPVVNGEASTLEVPYGTKSVTLLYKITVNAGTKTSMQFEDVGAERVSVFDDDNVDVSQVGRTFTVRFYRGVTTADIYVAKTYKNLVFDSNGECTVENVISEEIKATTTVTEKDPDKLYLDFSKFVQKELTATGTKTASDVNFTVDVKEFKTVISSIQGEEEVNTYAGEQLLSTTLTAHFDSITGGETKTAPFNGSIVVEHAGTYSFELTEEDGQRTGVTYDDSTYKVYVYVKREGDKLVVGSFDIYKDGWSVAGETITFHNTIDTGKDDYYPIIIPTIINKDTGMLNKTDHFAYVIGYPDGTVHPNGQITRAEVATIFFRLLRDEVRDGAFTTSNTYSDVAYGKWYNNPISTMSALGIITGYPDGTFKPNKPITRAEFAAIAARFDETQSGKSATFSDVIGHWAAKEIGIAYYNDWIKGYPDGTFKPDQNITRAEAMTLINRVLERKPESPADLLTNMNKWTDNMDTSKWYYLDVQEATNSHGYTRKTFNYELWRQMLPDPDWSRYER